MKRGPSPLLMVLGAALCVVVGALFTLSFGGRRSRRSDPPPVSASEISPVAPPRQPHRLPSPDPGGVRREVERATARALEEVKPPDLERYLDSLERRAREQGRVTALEVEPGMALAEALTGDVERAGRFARRMEGVQRELSARAGGVPSAGAAATPAAVEALAARIGAETDEPRRQVLIGEYLEAAQSLPDDEEQGAAVRRLSRIPGALPLAAPPANPDDLYRAIAEAGPDRRQADTARYLETVETLPDEEERGRRLRELERNYGGAAASR